MCVATYEITLAKLENFATEHYHQITQIDIGFGDMSAYSVVRSVISSCIRRPVEKTGRGHGLIDHINCEMVRFFACGIVAKHASHGVIFIKRLSIYADASTRDTLSLCSVGYMNCCFKCRLTKVYQLSLRYA